MGKKVKDYYKILYDLKPFNIGISNAANDEARRAILIANFGCYSSIFCTLIYQVHHLLYGWWNVVIFNFIICCIYGVIPLLNVKYNYRFTVVLFFITINIHLFVVANVYLGASSGVHYLFFTVPPFLILLLPKKDSAWRNILSLSAIVGFLFSEYISFRSPFNVNAPEINSTFMHILSTTSTVVFLTVIVAIFSLDVSRVKAELDEEHERSESLLLNILPQSIATRLKDNPQTIAETHTNISILFADIVGFTKMSSNMTPDKIVAMLNKYFTAYDDLSKKYDLEKIKTIGDAYMVVAGAPHRRSDHAEAIMKMATDMLDVTRNISKQLNKALTIRIGINSGEATAGVIGTRKFSYDLWGDDVNIASRMESNSEPGRIQVSEATFNLLRNKYSFERERILNVKGKGEVKTYL